jgi:hypothetical protein
MAYIVVWTVQTELADRYEYEDHYVVFDDITEASKTYDMLGSEESVYCVGLTRVMDATEPHWLED